MLYNIHYKCFLLTDNTVALTLNNKLGKFSNKYIDIKKSLAKFNNRKINNKILNYIVIKIIHKLYSCK